MLLGDNTCTEGAVPGSMQPGELRYAVVDVEVGADQRIHDIGALRPDGAVFHEASQNRLLHFLQGSDYLCGHNIVHHDALYLFGDGPVPYKLVDTLYLSPLLFPERPYHRLLKDDKLLTEQVNNPVNDCEKAHDLLQDEIAAWHRLPAAKQQIYASLLRGQSEFEGFLSMVGAENGSEELSALIVSTYEGKICQHADLSMLIGEHAVELAYALALADTSDYRSVTPGWVLHNYPGVEHVVRLLRHTPCSQGCPYCNRRLDLHHNLKELFGYDRFRTYEGEPLQEKAARAAVDGKSLLAIFPTGGGKSLTFQLPALMEGRTVHGLTVVISPLQSLMKDQVDNLAERGIADAVTINGLLDPISRANAIQRVQEGEASLLYIAPEMLRSNTIERILLSRHVVRFVIDEAHCFSSWGQDFRVDYLYIGRFIRSYQQKKRCPHPIPVSCFTATAKQKVIQDIRDYFRTTLGLHLELFASSATRTNLRYSVIHADTPDDKYLKLRSLVAEAACPTIVYVSRTRRTRELAERLTRDGYKALPFNGKMDSDEKVANQEAFMSDQVGVIVATSAFGMGVDKPDVGLVVHYDISESLENYVQEAGRAGRDPHLNARCYVLYSESDLDKHFILLNQTKLSISQIQQVWQAVKALTRQRSRVCCSALEIARQAGWDESITDLETRVRTALAALEQGGYLERGNNVPHVYATGITVRDVDEARARLMQSALFHADEVEKAVRIIRSLISKKHIYKAQGAAAESRIDYLADILALTKNEVVSAVERMRQEGILADSRDITAYLMEHDDNEKKAQALLSRFAQMERFLLKEMHIGELRASCRQLNDSALRAGVEKSTEKDLRTLLYFLTVKDYIRKKEDAAHNLEIKLQADLEMLTERMERRLEISRMVVEWLYRQTDTAEQMGEKKGKHYRQVPFSEVELLRYVQQHRQSLFVRAGDLQLPDIEEALLYLSKIGALKLEGGFLVLYNAMDIRRLKDNRRYLKDDYKMLDEFYRQKIQQVHIVGEYANLMVSDYQAALQYVKDYFQMDYRQFINRYFKGDRVKEIQRCITPAKWEQLFGQLSPRQKEIINDSESHCIVVAAGPGSGKTRVLVHKLASLLMLEDVKHEQLLMLTFSRAAVTEFKERLLDMVGNAAHYVDIKTFHSYSFDLLGRIGNLEEVDNVVEQAARMIKDGLVERSKISKTVLVIDEAQDMSADEYALVKALMEANEEMRVIAVGDDDQNIFEFRGADSRYMALLAEMPSSRLMDMTDNFRSSRHVVRFANAFASSIHNRLKKAPVVSRREEEGRVEVTFYRSKEMYEPLVASLLRGRGHGSQCVLTQTNEEATMILSVLRRQGVNCQLIQSTDGFSFWKLAEVRYFLRHLGVSNDSLVPLEVWQEAKLVTYAKYERSRCLPYLKRCVEQFEKTNQHLYRTDFREFVFESSIDDFCEINEGEVIVSTIHKAKGREFDDVYMLIANNSSVDDRLLRQFYVGMTRARNRLFIHTNMGCFPQRDADVCRLDEQSYSYPSEIVLQMGMRDVSLGHSLPFKRDVLALQSGDALCYSGDVLYDKAGHQVAWLSNRMRDALADWRSKGYHVVSVTAAFIVSWKPQDAAKDEPETAVLLADFVLTK